MFDNIQEDWLTYERNFFRPGMWVMVAYRFGRWRYQVRWPMLRKCFSLVYKFLLAFVQAASGTELPCEAQVGRRLRLDHTHGIVISGDAQLGDDVVLRNGVTIGLRRAGVRGAPVIGDRVDVGAGAKILGPIHIGNDVSIGANAVVLCDVPPNCIAVGIPARIRPKPIEADELEWAVPANVFTSQFLK